MQLDKIAPWQIERGDEPWVARSSEGQADYFATSYCLKEYFKGEDNWAALEGLWIPEVVETECRAEFRDDSDADAVCRRSSMAALHHIEAARNRRHKNVGDHTDIRAVPFSTLADIRAMSLPASTDIMAVSFSTPDTTVVEETIFEEHPRLQCRLDTFFNGALGRPRPACWFRTETPQQR